MQWPLLPPHSRHEQKHDVLRQAAIRYLKVHRPRRYGISCARDPRFRARRFFAALRNAISCEIVAPRDGRLPLRVY